MMKKRSFWLVALALAMLLTCTACGKKKASDADAAPDTKQEQTVESNTGDAAKSEDKQNAAKNEDKTDGTKTDAKTDAKTNTTDTKTDAANADQTAADEAKKLEEQKRLEEEKKKQEEEKKKQEGLKKQEEEQKKQEEEKKQEDSKKQPEQVIDPDTGKDKYETDPVPDGKPTPSEPQDTTVDKTTKYTCTISISCGTILANWDAWDEWDEETAAAKKPLVPSDGVILPSTTVTFSEGESVYDVLQRVCRENGIHMESSWTPMYNSAYVEGINNLYEFDVSQGSGWMYRVNGWFPNYGCSRYALQNGDVVEWLYTCDLGNDVGGGYAAG